MEFTTTKEQDRVSVRFERPMKHSVEKVWAAITEREQLNQWFPNDIGVDRVTADGALHYTFRGDEPDEETLKELNAPPPQPGEGEVLEFDPPRSLVITWFEGVLRFELTPTSDGCLLVFTHTVPDDGSRPARDSAGWQICLENLDESLGGPKASAPDLEGFKKLTSKYAAQLS